MKLKDVKPIIDKWFDETSPEDIIEMFEEMGVQFEDIKTSDKAELNIGNVVVSESCSCGSNDPNWHEDLGCRECR